MTEEIQDVPKETAEDLQEKQENSNEARLGKTRPWEAVLKMSVGPLIQNLSLSLYGIVESIYVSRSVGGDGLAVIGQVFVVEFLGNAIAAYLAAACSVRISYLLGLGKTDECSQLYIDFLRLAVIFSLFDTALILPLTKPIVKWFGADEKLARDCFYYMLSPTIGNFIISIQNINSNIFQATGHSTLYGFFQSLGFILNIGLFDPTFLFGFHSGPWGLSLATIISNLVAASISSYLIFSKKYFLKPEFDMFTRKFTSETWHALKVGASTLISYISASVPTAVVQKFFQDAATHQNLYNTMAQVWTTIGRLYQIACSIALSLALGTLPPLAYAYGAKKFKRFFSISIYGLIFSTIAAFVISIIISFIPRQVAKLWSSDEVFLDHAVRAIPIAMYTGVCWGMQYVAMVILQSMKKVKLGLIQSILTQVIPLPVFSALLYFTKNDDAIRVLFAFILNDVWSFIVSLLFLIKPALICIRADPDDGPQNEDVKKEAEEESISSEEEIEGKVPEEV